MPVPVITLADLLRDLTQQAVGDARKRADFLPQSLAFRWLSDGYRELVRRVQFLTNTYTANLTTSVDQAAPADILDRLTFGYEACRVTDSHGHEHPLKLRDWDYVRLGYPNLSFPHPHGFPHDWAWDEANPGQLLILPPSPWAISNGLSLDYIQDPGTLWRLYDDDVAQCAVVNGSPVVNLASAMPYPFQVGDVFGVKWNAQDLPDAWYKITQVNTTTQITLSEPYAGASNATALFTMSQVSPCEWKRPALCAYSPVVYALFKFWERENQDRSINYRISFYGGTLQQKQGGKAQPVAVDGELARIAKACGDRPGLEEPGKNVVQAYAGNRARCCVYGSHHLHR